MAMRRRPTIEPVSISQEAESYSKTGVAMPVAGTTEITVACIDVGSSNNLASFVADYGGGPGHWKRLNSPGHPVCSWTAADTRNKLVRHLVGCMNRRPVALGFEAPLWGWVKCSGGLDQYVLRPGIEKRNKMPTRSWLSGGGASSALVTTGLAADLLRRLVNAIPDMDATYGLPATGRPGLQPPWKTGTLLIWEAFISGQKCCQQRPMKVSSHRHDAQCGVVHGFVPVIGQARSLVVVPKDQTWFPILGERLPQLVPALSGSKNWWREPCLVVEPHPVKPQHWS